ncbi:MAG: hypothetical protein OEM52_10040, partial [bacterium]|nr:hypothetical protein [bacterium]
MNRDASLKQNRLLISALFSILLVSLSFAQDSLTITRVFNHSYPGSITWDVSLLDNYLYVDSDPGSLQTWNITSPNSPVSINNPLPNGGGITQIDNNYAFMAARNHCSIVNISNPSHLTVTTSFTVPFADHVVVIDSLVYVADRYVGIHIYSVANPLSPQLIRDVTNSGISSIAVEGNRLYAGQTSGGLSVYDITNRTSPILIGSIAGTSTARRLVVRDGIVYVANFDAGVKVYNATNPSSIQLLNQWHGFSSGNTCDVLLADNRLYVANGTNGLWVFDVSNPAHFVQIGRYVNSTPIILRLVNNILYAAEYSTGFSIYRVDSINPPPPPPVGDTLV